MELHTSSALLLGAIFLQCNIEHVCVSAKAKHATRLKAPLTGMVQKHNLVSLHNSLDAMMLCALFMDVRVWLGIASLNLSWEFKQNDIV